MYNSWRGMRERCNNKANKAYKWYGAKGITVSKEWDRFANFAAWAIANGYKEGLTIERIDSNLNYEPSNCEWITHKANVTEANSNRYRQAYVDGYNYWIETKCTGTDLAKIADKSYSVTCGWIRGWKANNNQLLPPGKVTAAR